MSKRCAKCEKTVYPLEELKCLDKVWHKACFRCWECNMALNMKNYKGYDKKPYCNAHYPTTRFTAVADTPEMSRIAENTKMQSQVKYHEDFEKNIKGSKIQVADDPETLRIKASTNVISGVEYKGLRERTNDMEARRSSLQQDDDIAREHPKRISGYDPTKVGGMRMMAPAAAAEPAANPSPYSNKNIGHSTVYSSQGKVEQSGNKRVGSIADYDPLNENFGSLQHGYAPASTMSQTQQWEETIPEPAPQNHNKQHYPAPQHGIPAQPVAQPPPQPVAPQPVPQQQPQPAKVQSSGPMYQAMYDYDAQDDDEVGFNDGDIIVDCQPIDEGWMFGTIRRTGKRGMLPANYVEQVQ